MDLLNVVCPSPEPPKDNVGDAEHTYRELTQKISEYLKRTKFLLIVGLPGAGKTTYLKTCLRNKDSTCGKKIHDEYCVRIYKVQRRLTWKQEFLNFGRLSGEADFLKEISNDCKCYDNKHAGKKELVIIDDFHNIWAHKKKNRDELVGDIRDIIKNTKRQDKVVFISDIPLVEGKTRLPKYRRYIYTISLEFPIPVEWAQFGISNNDTILELRIGAMYFKVSSGENIAKKLWVSANEMKKIEQMMSTEEFLFPESRKRFSVPESPEFLYVFAQAALFGYFYNGKGELRKDKLGILNKNEAELSKILGEKVLRWGWRRSLGIGTRPIAEVVFGETYYVDVYRYLRDQWALGLPTLSEVINRIRFLEQSNRSREIPWLRGENLFWQGYLFEGWMSPALSNWYDIIFRFSWKKKFWKRLAHLLLFLFLYFILTVYIVYQVQHSIHSLLFDSIFFVSLVTWLFIWAADFYVLKYDLPLSREPEWNMRISLNSILVFLLLGIIGGIIHYMMLPRSVVYFNISILNLLIFVPYITMIKRLRPLIASNKIDDIVEYTKYVYEEYGNEIVYLLGSGGGIIYLLIYSIYLLFNHFNFKALLLSAYFMPISIYLDSSILFLWIRFVPAFVKFDINPIFNMAFLWIYLVPSFFAFLVLKLWYINLRYAGAEYFEYLRRQFFCSNDDEDRG